MTVINERDFRQLDLNLLLVFHALREERSVTRAAQRLFIGQPALSGALKRLRAALGDELFVRTSHGMQPTARALELGRAIDPLLAALQEAMHRRPAFDPGRSERVFRIGLSDALEVALLPRVMHRLGVVAPGVRLIAHNADRTSASALLDAGTIELALGVFLDVPAWQRTRALFDWTFVCVFDPAHVAIRARRLTMAQYLRHPHLLTSFSADLRGFVDEQLARLGHERRVVLSSPHFATSPLVVREMAALTTVPTFVASAWRDALGLAVARLPFDVPTWQVSAMWSATAESDPGLMWLAGVFEELHGGGSPGVRSPGVRSLS
jgi:LysR family transcriptional activator of mexEF-oprN operon